MGFRIPSAISGALSKSKANMVFGQQPACAVVIYSHSTSKTRVIYSELLSVECSRDISDVGGSFSFTLAPTEPWDELIFTDDFVRIFMGDTAFSTQQGANSFYNVAGGDFSLNSDIRIAQQYASFIPTSAFSKVFEDIPNAGNKKVPLPKLFMYERFMGKVDRVNRNEDEPGADHGAATGFTVSGRSIGSLLQDITLYYNEWIPGLNAVNLFYDANPKVQDSPTKMVQQFLKLLLTTTPFPQWQIPSSLALEFITNPGIAANIAEATGYFIKMRTKINSISNLKDAKTDFLLELNSLLTTLQTRPDRSPLSLFSFDGFLPTFGTTYSADFLRSATTGVMDFVKGLSNDFANEFFVDLCPDGDPDGGNALNGAQVPTIVMRQRPYDITEEMLNGGLATVYAETAKTMSEKYLPPDMSTNNSLDEMSKNGFSVFGRCQKSDISDVIASNNFIQGLTGDKTQFIPEMIKYNCGFSGHDRYNGFQVLPRRGGMIGFAGGDKVVAALDDNGFLIDAKSISRYGFRMMETQSVYCEPDPQDSQSKSYQQNASKFTQMLANWYFMNPLLLNGTMICRFLPEARLGVPMRYFETAITPKNPYPKMELYYVQGITDSWVKGGIITTTLSLTRGLRYDLSKSSGSITSFLDGSINSRAASALGALV